MRDKVQTIWLEIEDGSRVLVEVGSKQEAFWRSKVVSFVDSSDPVASEDVESEKPRRTRKPKAQD